MNLLDYPELMLVAELCAFLRCSRGAAYQLIRDGKVEAVRVGRIIRVKRESVAAWLKVAQQ